MNILTSVKRGFELYGNTITIQKDNGLCETTGFIQPISYRGSKYYNFNNTDISARSDIRYLLICKNDADFDKGDRICLDNTTYIAVRVEKYIHRNRCLYKWAILKLYYPEQEDDFVDNN